MMEMKESQSNNLGLAELVRVSFQTLWVHTQIQKRFLHKYTRASLSLMCTQMYFVKSNLLLFVKK